MKRNAEQWAASAETVKSGNALHNTAPIVDPASGFWNLRKQRIPTASNRSTQAGSRRHEDVCLARFNFLQRADIQVGKFCHSFLGKRARHALPS